MHVLAASQLGHDVHAPAGVRTLFDDLSFGLTTEDAVAIVGPNGSGKSTLLRILVGEVQPTRGQVVPAGRSRIAWLAQRDGLRDDVTAIAAVTATPGVADHEAAAWLDRFGVDPARPVGEMSGGQRRRVTLAAALSAPSDLLVLDEPTNHLDVQAIEQLESHLAARAGGLLLVTHDRLLLDRIATRMLDLHDAPTWIEGSYRDVLSARADRATTRDRMARVRRGQLRRELQWLQRAPRARGTKAEFRVARTHDLQTQVAHDAADDDDPDLLLPTGRRRLGTRVLDVDGVTITRGGQQIATGFDLQLGPGDRVGFVGVNGAGKTTLLQVLDEELEPDEGTVRWGPTVHRATFHQQARAAPSGQRVLQTVLDIAPRIPLADGTDLPAARLAERFGFGERLQQANVADLSGGERRRLALLHLLVGAPNVLILDEPTNDLDLDTLRALEDHLAGFDGTVLVASHDRFLLERVATRLFGLDDGRVVEVPSIDAWRALVRADGRPATRESATATTARTNQARVARSREVRQLTQRMDRLGKRAKTLEDAMAAAGADVDEATRLHHELTAVRAELESVEDAWLDATT